MTTRKYYPEVDARGRIIPEVADGRVVGGRSGFGAAREREFARLGRILEATRDLEGLEALNNLRELVQIPMERGAAPRGASAFGPGQVDYLTLPDLRTGNQGARSGGIGSLDWVQFGEGPSTGSFGSQEFGEPSEGAPRARLNVGRWGLVSQDGDDPPVESTTPAEERESAEATPPESSAPPPGSGAAEQVDQVWLREFQKMIRREEAAYRARHDDWWERAFDGVREWGRLPDPGPDAPTAAEQALARELLSRFRSPGIAWTTPRPQGPRVRPAPPDGSATGSTASAPVLHAWVPRGSLVDIERRVESTARPATYEDWQRMIDGNSGGRPPRT